MNNSTSRKITWTRKLKFESIEPIRAIYRSATKAFLYNHHLQVWYSISTGFKLINQIKSNQELSQENNHQDCWWIKRIQPSKKSSNCLLVDYELFELDRKFQILRITFLTCIYNHSTDLIIKQIKDSLTSTTAQQEDQLDSLESLLQILLTIQDHPIHLLLSLWQSIHSNQPDLNQILQSSSSDHHHHQQQQFLQQQLSLPSHRISHIHPSILTAIGLASIKLNIPQIGKQLIETWLGSMDNQTMNALNADFNSHLTASSSSADDLNPSSLSDLGLSYHKLIQVYSIHILGSLNEWDFAVDFINSHAQQAGGILPTEIAQSILEGIQEQKTLHTRTIQQSILRQQKKKEEREKMKQAKSTMIEGERSMTSSQLSQTKAENINAPPSRKRRSIKSHDHTTSESSHSSNHSARRSITNGANQSKPLRGDDDDHQPQPGAAGASEQGLRGYSALRSHLQRFLSSSSERLAVGPQGTTADSIKLSNLLGLSGSNGLLGHHHASLKLLGASFVLCWLVFKRLNGFSSSSSRFVALLRNANLSRLAKLLLFKLLQIIRFATHAL